MEKVKKGDIVARKSYGCDILFLVEKIMRSTNGTRIAILKGMTIRIVADAYLEDLVVYDIRQREDTLRGLDAQIDKRINQLLQKSKKKILSTAIVSKAIKSGKILHLDGDKLYSEKSERYYKKMGLDALVRHIAEDKQPLFVREYLEKYKPDILVLTGHDGMIKTGTKYADLTNYRNSRFFVQGVMEARKQFPSSNRLAIFAGACQSFFEAIIGAGANFASSPARILIDFMDPLIVAERIALTDRTKFVTIQDMVHELRDGKKSIDGSGVMGKSNCNTNVI